MSFLSGARGGKGQAEGGELGGEGLGGEKDTISSLTETLWRKGNRTVVVWGSLRGDGKAPPFDSVEAMSIVTGGFIIEGEGTKQIARLSNIDVRNVSQRDHSGFRDETAQVSLDHREEAVFLLLTHLMRYVLDGNIAFGQASLRRTDKLVERFRAVVHGVRTFYAQNTRVALSEPFRGKPIQCFNKDLQEWTKEVFRQAHMLKLEVETFQGPSDVYPVPLSLSCEPIRGLQRHPSTWRNRVRRGAHGRGV